MLNELRIRNRQVGASAYVANKLTEELKEYMISSDSLDNSEPTVFRVKDGIVESLSVKDIVQDTSFLYTNPYKDLEPLNLPTIKSGNRKDKRFTPKKKKRKK